MRRPSIAVRGAGDDTHCGEGDAANNPAGNDTVKGGDGDDWLDGGVGNDLVLGGDGDDSIRGNDGKDTLAGQTGGEDRLFNASAAEVNEVFTFDDRFLFV